MKYFIFFIPFLLLASHSESRTLELGNNLIMDWNRREDLLEIHISAIIGEKDWIGVGFSDNGDLENSDLCILWRDWKQQIGFSHATISDSVISLKNTNNCFKMKWKISKSDMKRRRKKADKEGKRAESDDVLGLDDTDKELLEYIYSRRLESCQPGDYRIREGTTHVVYITGGGPLYKLDGLNISSQPNIKTGMQRTRLREIPNEIDPESRPVLIRSQNVTLPDSQTLYWCTVFKLPSSFSRKHHVTGYEPYFAPGNKPYVHHMEVFHCDGEEEFPLWQGSCGSADAPEPLKKCKKVLAAWAIGAGPFNYPEEAGLALGGPGFSPYIMLEVHYNNEELVPDVVDSSGIKLHVTPDLRRFDAGIMELGLIYNDKMAIPPGSLSFPLTGVCVPECTGVALPEEGIVIFGSQLHTHGSGVKARTTLVRAGKEFMVNSDPHYSTHWEEIRLLDPAVQVRPGDALLTTCLYNTQQRENVTLGGFSFADEMCVNYVHYYPRIPLEVCKSSVSQDVLDTYFTDLQREEAQDTDPKKTVSENYRRIRWNSRRSRDLHELYTTQPMELQCMKGNGQYFPGNWNSLPQVNVTQPFRDMDTVCRVRDKVWGDCTEREFDFVDPNDMTAQSLDECLARAYIKGNDEPPQSDDDNGDGDGDEDYDVDKRGASKGKRFWVNIPVEMHGMYGYSKRSQHDDGESFDMGQMEPAMKKRQREKKKRQPENLQKRKRQPPVGQDDQVNAKAESIEMRKRTENLDNEVGSSRKRKRKSSDAKLDEEMARLRRESGEMTDREERIAGRAEAELIGLERQKKMEERKRVAQKRQSLRKRGQEDDLQNNDGDDNAQSFEDAIDLQNQHRRKRMKYTRIFRRSDSYADRKRNLERIGEPEKRKYGRYADSWYDYTTWGLDKRDDEDFEDSDPELTYSDQPEEPDQDLGEDDLADWSLDPSFDSARQWLDRRDKVAFPRDFVNDEDDEDFVELKKKGLGSM